VPEPTDFSYLGDGVYVCLENGMVKLMTGSHDNPDNTIYLETEVVVALEYYVAMLRQKVDN
jgi:hypothetical protein